MGHEIGGGHLRADSRVTVDHHLPIPRYLALSRPKLSHRNVEGGQDHGEGAFVRFPNVEQEHVGGRIVEPPSELVGQNLTDHAFAVSTVRSMNAAIARGTDPGPARARSAIGFTLVGEVTKVLVPVGGRTIETARQPLGVPTGRERSTLIRAQTGRSPTGCLRPSGPDSRLSRDVYVSSGRRPSRRSPARGPAQRARQ